MKAMQLSEIASIDSSPLKLVDVPVPEPGAREVLVRVHCCAICRTDLHVIEGDLEKPDLPLIPGHQVVGTVESLGADCRELKPGERVGIAWLRHTCQACDFCERGQENLCESSTYTGYNANGGYAEYAVVPEDYAYRIPDAFEDIHAAPLLCSGIIGYRALKRCQLPEGGSIALYGFGSSAHVVIQIARHRGSDVYVVTRGEGHQQLGREMGAVWSGGRAEDMPVNVDSAIMFAPAGELVPPALKKLRPGGALSMAGIHMSDIPSMNYKECLFYERDLHSVTANTREDGRELLAEAAEIPIQPEVTTYALESVNEALQDLKADRINGSGVIVIAND